MKKGQVLAPFFIILYPKIWPILHNIYKAKVQTNHFIAISEAYFTSIKNYNSLITNTFKLNKVNLKSRLIRMKKKPFFRRFL
jgi:hypothetical protein